MITQAFIVVLGYWLISAADSFLGTQAVSRPIVVAPVIGLLLGDLHTGLIMGASLEAIFMGISAIGGSTPADATMGSVIATAFAILSGYDIEASFALALPIGTIMSGFDSFTTPVWAALAPVWERLAVENEKKFMVCLTLFQIFIAPSIKLIILFISIAFGVEALQLALNSCPSWITAGIGASSGMLIGVGLSILLSMIYSLETIPYLFVGYIGAKILGLSTLTIAILGAVIALAQFFNEKKILDLKKAQNNMYNQKAEEDFF